MKIELHRRFLKAYAKQPKKIQEKFKERRNLFIEDIFYPLLNNHSLSGEYEGCRSINITGNIRAIFYVKTESDIAFINRGLHPELYE